jgi:hypothetical protein
VNRTEFIIDGGGKYRVKVERVVDESKAARYDVYISPALDKTVMVTILFDTLDQASGFIGDVTAALLACVAGNNE